MFTSTKLQSPQPTESSSDQEILSVLNDTITENTLHPPEWVSGKEKKEGFSQKSTALISNFYKTIKQEKNEQKITSHEALRQAQALSLVFETMRASSKPLLFTSADELSLPSEIMSKIMLLQSEVEAPSVSEKEDKPGEKSRKESRSSSTHHLMQLLHYSSTPSLSTAHPSENKPSYAPTRDTASSYAALLFPVKPLPSPSVESSKLTSLPLSSNKKFI